jgi:hypothetical protein
MTDLKTRFQSLDTLRAPDVWPQIEARARAKERDVTRPFFWVVIGVAVMLALVIGGAVLLGSGMVKLTTTSPSTTPATTPITGPSTAPTTEPRTPHPAAWVAAGSMLEARTRHTATLLADGRVLVAGGSNESTWLASAELFDPGSGSWTPTGSMIEALLSPKATLLLDGTVLVIGYQVLNDGDLITQAGTRYPTSAELYDPRSGTWRATGDPGSLFSDGMTATLLPNGNALGVYGSAAEIYDAGTGSWRATGPVIDDRAGHGATLLSDGKVLVVGGTRNEIQQDNRSWASAEVYDPITGTWSATGSLAEGRYNITATRLVDGTVLVASGLVNHFQGTQELASSELYDPVSGTWAGAGNMVEEGFSGATFTLLLDGTVLAVGQAGGAELFDPVSRTWKITARTSGGSLHATATRLADGTVLVAGGYWNSDADGHEIPVASAEIYEPVSGN